MTKDLDQHFSQLKTEVLKEAEATHYKLEEVKLYFKTNINSKRKLSKANDLPSIIQLLEERNVLNKKNVTCLQHLGQLLNNSEIKDLVRVYQKMFIEDSEYTCLCGLSCPYSPNNPTSSCEENKLPLDANNNNNDPLAEALRNVSLRIENRWPELVRELGGVIEKQIDDIRDRYPNLEEQAYAALDLWRKTEKGNATIERLDEALDSRLCKKNGLGSFLRRPVIGLTC